MEKLILVTGATGRQGSAVVRHLLGRDCAIRAITRNPETMAAQDLLAQGVDVHVADLEEPASLRPALAGVYGVFSVQNFWERGVGYEGEIRQAKNLALAASEAEVSHFVYSSIAACDEAPDVAHFACKWEGEKLVDQLGLPRTFLRPVFFMENFNDSQFAPFMFPALSGTLGPETLVPLLSVDDLGWFAAEALDEPESYLGKTLELAGDILTVGEMKEIYSRVTGNEPSRFKIPSWLLGVINPEMAAKLRWAKEKGWHIQLDELRGMHPKMITFEEFARGNLLAS
jgi:uncharacterized protein YbjT (DUF2867 family)